MRAFYNLVAQFFPSFSPQVVPAAEEITQNRIQPAAKMVAEQAVPTAKEFTEGQLKPAAQAVADNVRCLPVPYAFTLDALFPRHMTFYGFALEERLCANAVWFRSELALAVEKLSNSTRGCVDVCCQILRQPLNGFPSSVNVP